MTRVAVYAGSFDPITRGHQDIIERGSALFDRLVVAVGHNVAKRYALELGERCDLVSDACSALGNVEVVSFEGLLVDEAKRLGATVILRGLRALSDFDLEFRNGLANREMSGIETMLLLASPGHIFLSSSLVREIAGHRGDVSRYVTPKTLAALDRRFGAG